MAKYASEILLGPAGEWNQSECINYKKSAVGVNYLSSVDVKSSNFQLNQ